MSTDLSTLFCIAFKTCKEDIRPHLAACAGHTANMVRGYQYGLPDHLRRAGVDSAIRIAERLAKAASNTDSATLYMDIQHMDIILQTHLAKDVQARQNNFGVLAGAFLFQMAELQLRLTDQILKTHPPENKSKPASFYGPMILAMHHLSTLPEGVLRLKQANRRVRLF